MNVKRTIGLVAIKNVQSQNKALVVIPVIAMYKREGDQWGVSTDLCKFSIIARHKEVGHMSKSKKAPNSEEVQATIKQLIQQTLREALEAELEKFLGYSRYERSGNDNSGNGYSSKTVKTSSGPLEIQVPRDRKGRFEPKLIRKRQTMLDEI